MLDRVTGSFPLAPLYPQRPMWVPSYFPWAKIIKKQGLT